MKRFVVEIVLISLGATLVWWLTADLTRPATVAFAKFLHRFAGYPAPYLLADLKPYYWFSPLFPPLAGLILASRWLPYKDRFAALAVGLACFWLVVGLQIVMVYSPYLPLSDFRSFVERMCISAGYIAAPVVLWLLLTGGPGALLREQGGWQRAPSGPGLFARRWHGYVAAALFSVLFSIPVFVGASMSKSDWSGARKMMARGVYGGDSATTLVGIQTVLPEDPANDALLYWAAQLHKRRGEVAEARDLGGLVLGRRRMMGYFDREFGATPAPSANETGD